MNFRTALQQELNQTISLEGADERAEGEPVTEEDTSEQQQALADTSDDLSTLDSVQTALESIAHELRANAEAGLNQQSGQFLRIALEQQYARVGLTAATPALEAFNTNPRLAATISLEEVEEKKQTLWESIKALLARAKKFIVDLWNRLFSSKKAEEATKEAEEAQKTAAAGKAPPSDATMPVNQATYHAIFTDEGTTNGALNALTELVNELLPHVEGVWQHVNELDRTMTDLLESTVSEAELSKAVDRVIYAGHFKGSTSIDGHRVRCSGVLPGHRQFYSTTMDASKTGFDRLEAAFATLRVAHKRIEGKGEVVDKARPLSTEEIGRVHGYLSAIAKTLDTLKGFGENTETKIEALEKHIGAMAADAEEMNQHNAARLYRLVAKVMIDNARGLAFVVSYLNTVAQHFGHFCKQSAIEHKEATDMSDIKKVMDSGDDIVLK